MRQSGTPCSQTIINTFLVFLALFTSTAYAQTTQPVIYASSTAEAIVRAYAAHYGVSGDSLYNTLKCESGLSSVAVGDHGTSYGVAQIHLPAHPDITKMEALDPIWSINWAAKEFSLGKQDMWSCYKEETD